MKDKEYLYVMDYSVCLIYKIELDEEDDKLDTVALLSKYGFHESECTFMFSKSNLDHIIDIKENG